MREDDRIDPELEAELSQAEMSFRRTTQNRAETGDNSSEGKHKDLASEPNNQPTETTMNEGTQQQNSSVDTNRMSPEEKFAYAARQAEATGKKLDELLGWKHRSINAAGTAAVTVALGAAVWGIASWLGGGSEEMEAVVPVKPGKG
jgi:hypothetical protein